MVTRTFEAGLPPDVQASLLDTVYATAPIGLCFLDAELRYVVINEHLAALHGLPVEAHIGRKLSDVLKSFGGMLEPFYRRVLDTGAPIIDMEVDGTGYGPPWEGRSWLVCYFPVRCRAGDTVGVNAVIKEITEQKKTEAALRAAEQRASNALRRLTFALEKAEAAEWEVDCRTGIARWSPQMYALYGISPDTKPGTQSFLALLHPDDRAVWQAARERACTSHSQEFRQDFRINHPVKGLRWISSRAYLEYDDAGQPQRIGGIKIDITDQMKILADLAVAKEEAERANEAKSHFLAAASHDLRQPIQALCLYHGVLAGRAKPADVPVLMHIEHCVSSLNELLADLLDLSKLDAGVTTPQPGNFPINDLLTRIASARLPDAEKNGLKFRFVPSSVVGRTDGVLFERMLSNLAANAVRYTRRGGVVMGCRRYQGKVWVEVWDSGIGIPKEMINDIFQPFRQLGNPERSREKGSGLGLAIVKKTADLLGLQIRVSSWPGRGSMFAIELPQGEMREMTKAGPEKPLCRSLRIAVLDDDRGVRDAITCALETMGHHVVAAASAAELIDHLGRQAPDLMIADYRLGGEATGLHAIAAVRTGSSAPFPAVVLTGDTDPAVVRLLSGGGIRVLHKPLQFEALQTCVAELMEPCP